MEDFVCLIRIKGDSTNALALDAVAFKVDERLICAYIVTR